MEINAHNSAELGAPTPLLLLLLLLLHKLHDFLQFQFHEKLKVDLKLTEQQS